MDMPMMPGLMEGEEGNPEGEMMPPEEPIEEEGFYEKSKAAVEEARWHADDAAQLAEQLPEGADAASRAEAAATAAEEAFAAVEAAKMELDGADPEDLNTTAAAEAALEAASGPVFEALNEAMAANEEIKAMMPQSTTAEPGQGVELQDWASTKLTGGE